MKHKISLLCIFFGGSLLLAAMVLSVWFLYENSRASQSSQSMELQLEQLITSVVPTDLDVPASRQEIPDYLLDPSREMPAVSVDGNVCIGVLEIPALKRKLPVIRDWSYENLRIAPCRYEGSVYDGSLIIAAHNYAAHFGSLSALKPGDAVRFTDMDGNVFSYQVSELLTISPNETEILREGGWDLTLFTCTFGNTYRTVVRCCLQ